MAHSATTRREHRFEDRFATTLRLLQIEQLPERGVLSRWVDHFGELIAQDAEMVDGADEVVEELAHHVRLAIVSNYPHAPVAPEADITLSDLRQLTAWCNLPSGGRER